MLILYILPVISSSQTTKLSKLDSLMLIYETSYSNSEHPDLIESIYNELSKGNFKHLRSFLFNHESKILNIENKKELIELYRYLSKSFYSENILDSCLYFARKASFLSKEISDPLYKAISDISLGEALYTNMKLDSANNLLFEALEYLEKHHATSFYLGECYHTLAQFYSFLGTPRKAIEFNNKALEVFEKLDKPISIAKVYYTMGSAHLFLDDKKKALLFYNSSILLCKKHKHPRLLSSNYYSVAKLEKDSANINIAKQFVKQAIEIDKKLESNYGLAYDYLLLGEIFYELDSLKLAKSTIHQALELSKTFRLSGVILSCLNCLVDIEYKAENYKDALNYNMQINQLVDSLRVNIDIEKLQEVEKKYQSEKQEYEVALTNQKSKFRNILVLIAVCFLFLVLAFLWFIQRAKAKRLKLEQSKLKEEIDYKNKLLATNVMYLANKNEFISSMSKKLILLKENTVKHENSQTLTELVNDIELNLDDDIWKEFELRFHEVHTEFYKKLDKLFPDLTRNERRLAAFLKLNMSTKEISSVTNQSIPAVEMARSRLRKKLNIQNTDLGLSQYITQL